jgi:two-component system sensor histidine kinase RegB
MAAAAMLSVGVLGTSDLMPRLLALAAVLGALNGCFHFAASLERNRGKDIALLSPFLQLSLDLIAWGIYIYFSGGTTNPLISVLLPLVAIGAIVLRQVQAWMLGGLAIMTYSVLSQEYEPLAITDVDMATHLHLVGMWIVFVVSAIVLTWFILQLTRALRERDVALAAAREQAIRNDWLVSIGSLAAEAAHELSTLSQDSRDSTSSRDCSRSCPPPASWC